MFTEQKPPCAAKLGVPNCAAQKPVRDWLWSRPVKKARRFGSVSRTRRSQPVAVSSASAQEISLNSPEPRSPTRSSGALSRAGEYCVMMPAEPLPHSTPRFTGWSGLPSM
jgi:hypothetical protein